MKRILIGLITLIILFTFVGCKGKEINNVTDAIPEAQHVVYSVVMKTGPILYTFQDPVTGVWYYAMYNGGLTPRYNPDGTLHTTEVLHE